MKDPKRWAGARAGQDKGWSFLWTRLCCSDCPLYQSPKRTFWFSRFCLRPSLTLRFHRRRGGALFHVCFFFFFAQAGGQAVPVSTIWTIWRVRRTQRPDVFRDPLRRIARCCCQAAPVSPGSRQGLFHVRGRAGGAGGRYVYLERPPWLGVVAGNTAGSLTLTYPIGYSYGGNLTKNVACTWCVRRVDTSAHPEVYKYSATSCQGRRE